MLHRNFMSHIINGTRCGSNMRLENMCSQNVYNLQDSITINKLKRMRWVGHIDAWDGKEMEGLVGEYEGAKHV